MNGVETKRRWALAWALLVALLLVAFPAWAHADDSAGEAELSGTARVSVVTELSGRAWIAGDAFHYTLAPLAKGVYVEDEDNPGTYSYALACDEETKTSIPLPADGNDDVDGVQTATPASARVESTAIGTIQHLAQFGDIAIESSMLIENPNTNMMEADFYYVMTPVIPAGATAENGYTYKGIAYDTSKHFVRIHVTSGGDSSLVVRVIYDEDDAGFGAAFTPVYSNVYNASADNAVKLNLYTMGRAWQAGERYDFTMSSVGGAPMADADPNDFPADENDSGSAEDVEAGLAAGKAVHTSTFAHRVRLVVPEGAQTGAFIEKEFPAIRFYLANLANTVQAGSLDVNGERIAYSDGTPVPAGLRYDRFVYAVSEVAGENHVIYDPDTEYAQVTLVDKGDGTLDAQVAIFEDRYVQVPRFKPAADGTATDVPASSVMFANRAMRDILVTKTWVGAQCYDVVLHLQKTTADPATAAETDWTEVTTFTLKGDGSNSDTERVDATEVVDGETRLTRTLTHAFTNLPVFEPDSGPSDQDLDLDDEQIRYRVVESSGEYETYYGAVADHVESETPVACADTGAMPDELGNALFIRNTVEARVQPGTARVSTVLELQGRSWLPAYDADAGTGDAKFPDGDAFSFELRPIGQGTYDGEGDLFTVAKEAPDGTAFQGVDPDKLRCNAAGEVALDIPMPAGFDEEANAARATARTAENWLTSSQRQANFADIPLTIADLQLVDGVWQADYFYELAEVAPPAGQERGIAYPDDVHEVRVHAEAVSGSIITSVSYDGAPVGSAVPVFTNAYDAAGTYTGYVMKHVNGRDWKDPVTDAAGNVTAGDAFGFHVVSIGGSIMRGRDDGGIVESPADWLTGLITNKNGTAVQTEAGACYAMSYGTCDYELSDLPMSGIGRFTYAMYEVNPRTDTGEGNPNHAPDVADIDYDDTTIYLRVTVTDQHDGTLATTGEYFSNAACTRPFSYAGTSVKPQVYVNAAGEIAGGDADGAAGADGATAFDAAFFSNMSTTDLRAKMVWVGVPAQDANVRIVHTTAANAKAADLNDVPLADIAAASAQPPSIGWSYVPGVVFGFSMRDFIEVGPKRNEAGECYYELSTDDLSADVQGLLRGLPTTDAQGRPITYGLVEITQREDTARVYSVEDDGTLAVTNTYEPKVDVSIAAVKELIGRTWLTASTGGSGRYAEDAFAFTLTPVGIGTMAADGKIVKDTSAKAVASVPTPGRTYGRAFTQKATPSTTQVASNEHLAQFGAITFTEDDLHYGPGQLHPHGDFYYELAALIPDDAKATRAFSIEVGGSSVQVEAGALWGELSQGVRDAVIAAANAPTVGVFSYYQTPFAKDGVGYSGKVSQVHIAVRDNASSQLIAQVIYDEDETGAGTPFTPVFTSIYDAAGTTDVSVVSRMAGRDWKLDEYVDVVLGRLGSAPFEAADESNIVYLDAGSTADDEEAALAAGKYVMMRNGNVKKRLSATSYGSDKLNGVFEGVSFKLSDLAWTVGADGAPDPRDEHPYPEGDAVVRYYDGDAAQEGLAYGRFTYMVWQLAGSEEGVTYDLERPEYAQVLVIDGGKGNLEVEVAISEDREGKEIRHDAATYATARTATFTNRATSADYAKATARVAWKDALGADLAAAPAGATVGVHLVGRDAAGLVVRHDEAVATAANGYTCEWSVPKGLVYEFATDGYEDYVVDLPEPVDTASSPADFEGTLTCRAPGAESGTVKATATWEDDNNRDGLRADYALTLQRRIGGGAWHEVPAADLQGATLTVGGAVQEAARATVTVGTADEPCEVVWSGLATSDDGTLSTEALATAPSGADGALGTASAASAAAVEAAGASYVAAAPSGAGSGAGETGLVAAQLVGSQAMGEAVSYRVVASAPEGYTAFVAKTAGGTFAVNQVHVCDVVAITANVSWLDLGDLGKTRPAQVRLGLLVNGELDAAHDATVSSAEGWRHTWANLPKHDAAGDISYGVVALSGTTGYDEAVSQTDATSSRLVFDVVLTSRSASKSITAHLLWRDVSGVDFTPSAAKPTPKVTLQLVRHVGGWTSVMEGYAKVVPANTPNAHATWTDLPAYENGREITYSVTERGIVGYTPIYADRRDTANATTVVVINRANGEVAPSSGSGSSGKPAASTATKIALGPVVVKLSGAKGLVYNGKAKKPVVASVKLNGKTVPKSGYVVSYANNVKAGTATVKITGKGAYTGSVTRKFTIAKATQPLVAKAAKKTLSVKYAKVKKKAQAIAKKKAFKTGKNKGALTFKKTKGTKKILVSKAGKLTVKKGCKKGTYTVKVKVSAKATANYKARSKTVTLKVKVA